MATGRETIPAKPGLREPGKRLGAVSQACRIWGEADQPAVSPAGVRRAGQRQGLDTMGKTALDSWRDRGKPPPPGGAALP